MHGFGLAATAEQLERFLQPVDLTARLVEMRVEREAQQVRIRRFRHLRERLYELSFRVQQVLQCLDEHVLNHLRLGGGARAPVVDRPPPRPSPRVLKRGRLDELPVAPLVP